MATNPFNVSAYCRNQPEARLFPSPIIARRAPTANDINYPLGTLWINTVTAFSYILSRVANNTASWAQATSGAGDIDSVTGNAGGAVLPTAGNVNLVGDATTITSTGAGSTLTFGLVASPVVTGTLTAAALTVTPGPISLTGTTNINTSGAANTAIGSGTNTGTLNLGNIANAGTLVTGLTAGLDSAANGGISIGSLSLATGDIIIGDTLTSGNIQLGGSGAATGLVSIAPGTGNQTVNVANNAAGVKTVNIADGIAGNTISIGNGANASAQIINIANGASAANSTVSILSGAGSAGTGVLQLGSNARVNTIDIGAVAPAAARITTINSGNAAVNDTVNIMTGAPSAGAQSVNIMTGVATGGTQQVNIGTGNSVKTINIGSGAAASQINIGSSTAGNLTTLASPITALPGPVYIYTGIGDPAGGLALHAGDLYIRLDPAGAASRMFIATGAGVWTNFTCAA